MLVECWVFCYCCRCCWSCVLYCGCCSVYWFVVVLENWGWGCRIGLCVFVNFCCWLLLVFGIGCGWWSWWDWWCCSWGRFVMDYYFVLCWNRRCVLVCWWWCSWYWLGWWCICCWYRWCWLRFLVGFLFSWCLCCFDRCWFCCWMSWYSCWVWLCCWWWCCWFDWCLGWLLCLIGWCCWSLGWIFSGCNFLIGNFGIDCWCRIWVWMLVFIGMWYWLMGDSGCYSWGNCFVCWEIVG